ncbi:MAG: hypothetical protein RR216_05290 [Pseudoflavonifractor sp.]
MALLAGLERLALGDGLELRLLSALEVLQARREAERLAEGDRERALCSNACLLARALERDGQAAFESGEAVLMGLTAAEIGRLAKRWAEFNRGENPSPEDGEDRIDPIKKAWSTRLMSAFSGACSKALGRCPPRSGRGK